MTPYGNSPVEKKRGCEPPHVAMPRGSPPAQKLGNPAPIATSAVVPSPAWSIAHTTRSIASSNTKHRAVTRPMLRSSSHVDQTSLGPALVDSIRISVPQCKRPRGLSHSGPLNHSVSRRTTTRTIDLRGRLPASRNRSRSAFAYSTNSKYTCPTCSTSIVSRRDTTSSRSGS